MKILFPSLNTFRLLPVAAMVGVLFAASAFGEEVPESISSQWTVKSGQVELNWDSKRKILRFRQSATKAVVSGPSNLYELPYKISFHSEVSDASLLLILSDGNPTRISTKIIAENETGNPQIYLINKAGMIVANDISNAEQ